MDKMLFTSSVNDLSLMYLSSISQLNVGCFMAGLPILGPAILCGLSAVVAIMAWIATLVASATALATFSFIMICLLALIFYLYVCITEAFLLHTPCNKLCLYDDNAE